VDAGKARADHDSVKVLSCVSHFFLPSFALLERELFKASGLRLSTKREAQVVHVTLIIRLF
jgi:hypothetical protein